MKKEILLDKLTPISGSGPALFFLLSKILVFEIIRLGFEENIARKIVQQVFIGSAKFVESENHFENLISAVATKKGITEEILSILEPKLKLTMHKALEKAFKKIMNLKKEN